MPALERFFQLIVFNYAVCNGDAHLRNFSLLRTDDGEYALVPAYDLMSTVLHTPNESDTALDLYPDDISENYSGTNGHYGRSSFLELARRLGIVPARAARILNRFLDAQTEVEQLVGQSFLHDTLRQVYLKNYEERISRLKEV
jgi:serine/threonine-protein kinase HipA